MKKNNSIITKQKAKFIIDLYYNSKQLQGEMPLSEFVGIMEQSQKRFEEYRQAYKEAEDFRKKYPEKYKYMRKVMGVE